MVDRLIDEYLAQHGRYPKGNEQSTWFEVAVAETGDMWFPSGFVKNGLPTDLYGQPMMVFWPEDEFARPIIRSLGRNGVDDGGSLDEWDSCKGPNPGYWYMRNWTRIDFQILFFSLLGLVLSCIIVRHYRHRWDAATILVLLCFGLLFTIFVPIGADIGTATPSFRNVSPLGRVAQGWGGLFLIVAVVLTGLSLIVRMCRSFVRRERPITHYCDDCGYDLRGSILADRTRCPECGFPIGYEKFSIDLQI